MFCVKCGKEFPDTYDFCPFCGAPSSTKDLPEKEKKPKPAPVKEMPFPVNPGNTGKPPKRRKRTPKELGVMAGGILMIIVIAASSSLLGSTEPDPSQQAPKPAVTTTKEALKATPKATEKPQPKSDQATAAPLAITKFTVDKDKDGLPVITVNVENDSDKTIDQVRFLLTITDESGHQVRHEGDGEPYAKLMSQYRVAPQSQAENDFYWRLPGFPGGHTYKASLYDIQYTDGTSWMADESHPIVVQAVQSNQVFDFDGM